LNFKALETAPFLLPHSGFRTTSHRTATVRTCRRTIYQRQSTRAGFSPELDTRTNNPDNWRHYVRQNEIAPVVEILNGSVLEIGGGDGFLAETLNTNCRSVVSIDVEPKSPKVQPGNAEHMEFPNASFDVVLSSHVIAHIEDKPQALSEIRRVLKPGGIRVHIVPSPWWSAVTNIIHFAILPRRLAGYCLRRLRHQDFDSLSTMLLHPLGANPSFVHELWRFSVPAWRSLFESNGFHVQRVISGPLLQSGYRLFPFKAIRLRRFLAKAFCSSYCFVVTAQQ
jgi:SAM-dependent methyltransferase